MTVAELIAELETMPQDAPVAHDSEIGFVIATIVRHEPAPDAFWTNTLGEMSSTPPQPFVLIS